MAFGYRDEIIWSNSTRSDFPHGTRFMLATKQIVMVEGKFCIRTWGLLYWPQISLNDMLKNDVFWGLRRVALVTTDVSEEISASNIRVTKIGELGTTLAVTSDRRKLQHAEQLASVASYG
jgi:hypothetical protein